MNGDHHKSVITLIVIVVLAALVGIVYMYVSPLFTPRTQPGLTPEEVKIATEALLPPKKAATKASQTRALVGTEALLPKTNSTTTTQVKVSDVEKLLAH